MRLALAPFALALLAASACAQPPPVMEIPAPLDALLRQTRAQIGARLADALSVGVPEEEMPDQEALAAELARLDAELAEVEPGDEPSPDLIRRFGEYYDVQMKAYQQGDQRQASDLRRLLRALDEIEDSARRGARPDPGLLKFSSPERRAQGTESFADDPALSENLAELWRWTQRRPYVVVPDPGAPALREALVRETSEQMGLDEAAVDAVVGQADLDLPVEVVGLPPGLHLIQWSAPGVREAVYGGPGATADRLGLHEEGLGPNGDQTVRTWAAYRPDRPVRALRATAAAGLDTWTIPSVPYYVEGGLPFYLTTSPHVIPFPESEREAARQAGALEGAGDPAAITDVLTPTLATARERARQYPDVAIYDSIQAQLTYIQLAVEQGRSFSQAEVDRFVFATYAVRYFEREQFGADLLALWDLVQRYEAPYPSR